MRTLIVDDEPLARDVLRFFLADEPDAVVVAECEDGEQVLDAIRRDQPDLVFLDVQMPGWSGIEGLHRLEPAPPTENLWQISTRNEPAGTSSRSPPIEFSPSSQLSPEWPQTSL